MAMILKPRIKGLLIFLGLVVLFIIVFALFGQRYLLNKTVREIGLKFVQIEKLSLLEGIDYKFVFFNDHYLIYSFDATEEEWKKFEEHKYRNDVRCSVDGYGFIFSRARFRTYELKAVEGSLPRFVVLYFFSPKQPSHKKGIIFYNNEDWKVLK